MSIQGEHKSCPFCGVAESEFVVHEEACFAIFDRFPVTTHHSLIIPKRHVTSFQQMTEKEWLSVHRLAQRLNDLLKRKDPSIAGFNLGINDGEAAGQTVFHAHVHWIPRRHGDKNNPRGGVRGVIPDKADY